LFLPGLESIATSIEVEHFKVAADLACDNAYCILRFGEPLEDLPLLRNARLIVLPTWKSRPLLRPDCRQDRETIFAVSQRGLE
jgi:hypothetical protein